MAEHGLEIGIGRLTSELALIDHPVELPANIIGVVVAPTIIVGRIVEGAGDVPLVVGPKLNGLRNA